MYNSSPESSIDEATSLDPPTDSAFSSLDPDKEDSSELSDASESSSILSRRSSISAMDPSIDWLGMLQEENADEGMIFFVTIFFVSSFGYSR